MCRESVVLNGDTWRLGQAPAGAVPDYASWEEIKRVADWLPAAVPGNVQADLIGAGRLPDPSYGRQNEMAQWVDDHCWWLVRDFGWEAGRRPDSRAHLVLRGIDYVSDVFLNGRHLARHEGMFSPQTHEISDLLAADNRLAVRIVGSRWLPTNRSSAWEKVLNHLESMVTGQFSRFPHRRDTVKCQMSFGWDFAPSLRAMGIWDDVYIVSSQAVFIQDIAVRARVDGSRASVRVAVEIDSRLTASVRIRTCLAGETFDAEPIVVEQVVDLAPGANRYQIEIEVPEPRLWWPWDQGRPDLYRVRVEALSLEHSEQVLDAAGELIGLRQVSLDGLNLKISGRRVYARGANWVPADTLPGRVTEADYRHLLILARQANMNMLRVWGGGLREKRAFYTLCDRMGILLWQEFPLACAFLTRYPRSPEYLALVHAETRAIVRDLRNHPSITLWCGGNEFSPARNRPVVEAMSRAAAEDPTRPFWPASPHVLDSHNWSIWHGYEAASAYQRDLAGFASEFGLQAPPAMAALRRFIPDAEVWPPGPSWTYHSAGLDKLARYARPFLHADDSSLQEFVRASQQAQSYGLQIAIEHYRRRKAEGCGGALVWQLNEPWPAISWSLLDYYRRPKPAYETVKRLFRPILISIEYPLRRYKTGDPLCLKVWAINDTMEALPGCSLEVVLLDGTGRRVYELCQTVDVPSDSARVVAQSCWTLPEGENWRLICNLGHDGRPISDNNYDLTAHDQLGPGVSRRLAMRLGKLFIPA